MSIIACRTEGTIGSRTGFPVNVGAGVGVAAAGELKPALGVAAAHVHGCAIEKIGAVRLSMRQQIGHVIRDYLGLGGQALDDSELRGEATVADVRQLIAQMSGN